MFRKPRPHEPASVVLGKTPLSSPAESDPLADSPSSPKKQKTSHLPTPSRLKGPRQSQLNGFFTPSSSLPGAAKNTPQSKSTGKAKAKNHSILSFFKPLSQGGTGPGSAKKLDQNSDSLFIRHGAYGLDVSDPEDGEPEDPFDVDWDTKPQAAGEASSEELELTTEPPRPPRLAEKEKPAKIEGGILPTPNVGDAEKPKFDPSKLKLDVSSSMLFGAKLSSTPTAAAVQQSPTNEGDGDSSKSDAPHRPLAATNSPTNTAVEESGRGGVENGEDQGDDTPLTQVIIDVDEYGDNEFEGIESYSDGEDPEESFSFDPISNAIEGFDASIIMKPEDAEEEDDIVFTQEGEETPSCPICRTKLSKFSEGEANNHVNNCLDGGTPTKPATSKVLPPLVFTIPPTARTSNPHAPLATTTYKPAIAKTTSAFAKMMTNNTDAQAWATAAKNEVESRGKRAEERSCPFYKILFNGPIAVDAFRYGRVPGVNTYLLSHAHSDHYAGLTPRWDHGPIYCSRVTANFVRSKLGVDPKWVHELPWEKWMPLANTDVWVRGIDANHCPGSMLFLFERHSKEGKTNRVLHCGDFRADKRHLKHALLSSQRLDTVYLDTTYLNPRYAFPSQEAVINACAQMCYAIQTGAEPQLKQRKLFAPVLTASNGSEERRLLVVIGTYSIGKERICIGIAQALKTKIYCPPSKLTLMKLLEYPELETLLTTSPAQAQVHMTALRSVDTKSLAEYLSSCPIFTHIVGIRPSGWNYRPPASENRQMRLEDVLYASNWKSAYGSEDMKMERGSGEKARCYAVPYSEHSSFRELCMFACALDIGKIIPTVNVGSRKSRDAMNGWIQKWEKERRGKRFEVEHW